MEVDSLETVRDYLDSLVGEASENAYFQVGTDHAIGIRCRSACRARSPSRFSGSAAENYERYFVPAIGAPLATDLVELAALRPGERVLDVACGTGVVARHALERVGQRSKVIGTDINAGMLAVARAAAGMRVA